MINFNKPSFGTEKMMLITSDKLTPPHSIIGYYCDTLIVGASLSEPHTGRNFVLSTIHKKLRIKIEELTVASIFVRVMVHDTVKVTTRLQYFHICSCNGS